MLLPIHTHGKGLAGLARSLLKNGDIDPCPRPAAVHKWSTPLPCWRGLAEPRGRWTTAMLLGSCSALLAPALWLRAGPYWIRLLGALAHSASRPPTPIHPRKLMKRQRSHWRSFGTLCARQPAHAPTRTPSFASARRARRPLLTNRGQPPFHCMCTLRTRSDMVGRRDAKRNKIARESLAIERQATSDLSFEGLPFGKRRHEGEHHLLGFVWCCVCVVNV